MTLRIAALMLASVCSGWAQSFTNLDFELPMRRPWPPLPPPPNQADSLFPGWTPFLEPPYPGFGFPFVLLDNYCIGSPCVGLYSKASLPPIQGRLMVGLDPGGGGPGGFGEMGIRQVGMVPATARSLRFKAQFLDRPGQTLVVRLAGRQLALIPTETQTNYTTIIADISFASGVVSELSLAVLVDFSQNIRSWTYVDDVQFSPMPATPPSGPPSISMEPYVSTPPGDYDHLTRLLRFTGVLQIAEHVDGPFTEYPGAVSPYWVFLLGEMRFYRVIGYQDPAVVATVRKPLE